MKYAFQSPGDWPRGQIYTNLTQCDIDCRKNASCIGYMENLYWLQVLGNHQYIHYITGDNVAQLNPTWNFHFYRKEFSCSKTIPTGIITKKFLIYI